MEYTNSVRGNEIIAFADTSIYSKNAILKCLYWFGDKFHTNISITNDVYCISLTPLTTANIKDEELELYLQKLERDIIDFQLRDIIIQETQNIRDLLVAKAFSNGEFDEEPNTNVSDPVGFNPNLVSND